MKHVRTTLFYVQILFHLICRTYERTLSGKKTLELFAPASNVGSNYNAACTKQNERELGGRGGM